MLEDERMRKWVDYVARGSSVTAQVYFRRLGRVCEEKGLLPSDLLNKDEDLLWNFLNDIVSEMETNGRAGGYVQSTMNAVKSWLSFIDNPPLPTFFCGSDPWCSLSLLKMKCSMNFQKFDPN